MKYLRKMGCMTVLLVSLQANAQFWNTAGNNVFGTEYLGAALGSTVPLQLKTVGILPIDFYTTNTFRMRLNPRITYPTLNGFNSIVADGFELLSPNASFLASAPYGPFSRLHLADGTHDIQNFGYRSWQRNGISFTGNDDQGYIGQKYGDLDVTDMVIQWSDNPGFTKADRMRFIFTSQYQTSPGSKMNSLNGLEAMRLWPKDGNNVNVGVGDFASIGSDPSERFHILSGRARIEPLPSDPQATLPYKIMVVDDSPLGNPERGVVKWIDPISLGSGCEWTLLPSGNIATAYPLNPGCPQMDKGVGIGTDQPKAKLHVKHDTFTSIGKVGVLSDVYANSITDDFYAVYARAWGLQVGGTQFTAQRNTAVAGISTLGLITEGVYGAASQSVSAATYNAGVHGNVYIQPGVSYNFAAGVLGEITAPQSSNKWAGYFAGPTFSPGGVWTSSDSELKLDIEPVNEATVKILGLQPKSYHFNSAEYPSMGLPEGLQYGFVAQDLEEQFPDMVMETLRPAVRDSAGEVIYPEVAFKAVNTGGLLPILVAAFKEQQTTIDQQNSRMAELEDRINQCCAANGNGMAPQNGERSSTNESNVQEQRLLIIPNPVADLTTLEYFVPNAGQVSLQVSTSDGKPIATLREELAETGAYNYSWNTTKLSAGTYFCTFMLDGAVVVKRAVKVK